MNAFKNQKKVILYNYITYIFISILLIVSVNYYGLKAIDGMRAFTAGESLYMKAQQEASRQLTNYIFTGNKTYRHQFLDNLQVPINDSLARIALNQHQDDRTIAQHFILGGNNPKDVGNIIWVYKRFKSLSRFKKAIKIWQEADLLIIRLEAIGKEIEHELTANNIISASKKETFIRRINDTSEMLAQKGNEFDEVLGENIRLVNKIVLIVNSLIALIIFACIVGISIKYINKLSELQKDTMAQNEKLKKTNEELDLFTHSVSHDLRTPITSLKGLIALAETETSKTALTTYFSLMKQTLSRQDDFILKIIQFFKNKRMSEDIQEIHLPTFLKPIVQDLRYGIGHELNIIYEIEPKTIGIDSFRLNIICTNMISNAIKYADLQKEYPFIRISAKTMGSYLHIIFEDNGIGIDTQHLPKIFDIFYVTSHHNKGSGIGLYLVKEMVSKLDGHVMLTSEIGKGSTFSIKLPISDLSFDENFPTRN
jgi:signal transduction histidine kinase